MREKNITSNLAPILFPVGIMFFNFLVRVVFSPLLLSNEKDPHLNHAQAARFFLLIALGYSFAMIISGLVSSTFSSSPALKRSGSNNPGERELLLPRFRNEFPGPKIF